MTRVSEDQQAGRGHEQLNIVVIKFDQQLPKQKRHLLEKLTSGSRHNMIVKIDIKTNNVLINIKVNANIKMKASF